MAYSFKVKPGDTKLFYASNDELIEMLKKAEDEIRRLQKIQNLSTMEPKYKIGQFVYFIDTSPIDHSELFVRFDTVERIYKGKTKITYYLKQKGKVHKSGIDEKYLYPEMNLALIKLAEIKAKKQLLKKD